MLVIKISTYYIIIALVKHSDQYSMPVQTRGIQTQGLKGIITFFLGTGDGEFSP